MSICTTAGPVHAFPRRGSRSTPPTSPLSIRTHKMPAESGCPNSPRTVMKMALPSIATVSTPPSSPTTKKAAPTSIQLLPCSPTLKNMQFNLSSSASSSLNLKVATNDRIQPVAKSSTECPVKTSCPVKTGCPVVKTGCPVKKTGCPAKRKLGPGCSLLDWIRLCRSKTDLAGNGGEPRPVTPEELAKHNTEDDVWTAVRGKVYNLTYYLKFHPGGKEELMKGAGIDCTILFDEVHNYVNIEANLKACYVGPLVVSSPCTQRRNSVKLVKQARQNSKSNLTVTHGINVTDGVNKQRKTSMELRNETQAATACEEHDGDKQISPQSPVKPIIIETTERRVSTTTQGAAKNSSIRLAIPPTRIRRTSEPHPRFSWVQSEKAVIMHVMTKYAGLKNSDVVIDVVDGKMFSAAINISEWVFELNIALSHAVVSSQVSINCGRVEILLRKEVPHQQWENIGTYLNGHAQLAPKSKRGIKYHTTTVENIKAITHDTKMFTLKLPKGSYLNVPTGHHLAIKADIAGEEVERKYTPVSALGEAAQRHGHPASQQEGETLELMIKLYSNGKMSGYLSKLEIGDKVVVSDPEGTFDASHKLATASNILLLAAGSGFTPMVKILRDYLSTEMVSRQRNISASEASGEESQENQVAPELPPITNTPCDCKESVPATNSPKTAKLLFANKKERDIMYREELEHLSHSTAEKFTVTHVLSNPDTTWNGLRGRINNTLLEKHLPPPVVANSLVCLCGPEPFTTNITNLLVDMEYPDECIHIFQ